MKIMERLNGKSTWAWRGFVFIIMGLISWVMVENYNMPKLYAEKIIVQSIAKELKDGLKELNNKIDASQQNINNKIDTNQTNLHKKIDDNQKQLIKIILEIKK